MADIVDLSKIREDKEAQVQAAGAEELQAHLSKQQIDLFGRLGDLHADLTATLCLVVAYTSLTPGSGRAEAMIPDVLAGMNTVGKQWVAAMQLLKIHCRDAGVQAFKDYPAPQEEPPEKG